MSPTQQQFPLSPKKVTKKTLAATIAWIILFLIIGVPISIIGWADSQASFLSLIGFALFAILFVIVFLTYLYERWYFNTYFYDLGNDFIVIRKGPITPREITIPYERIQDVYVDQDIFDRIFNIYDVHLSSATISSGMEAHIDGVEKPAADGLREKLLNTVKEKIGKKAPTTQGGQSV